MYVCSSERLFWGCFFSFVEDNCLNIFVIQFNFKILYSAGSAGMYRPTKY